MRFSQQEFIDKSEAMMEKKGLEMQQLLLQRIDINEAHVADFETRLHGNESSIEQMASRIEQEYKDFANNRKRWKADFQLAQNRAVQNTDAIKAMLHGCENQNEVNTRAIKYMLDAQMIEQLVQRQDVEDRKQLLVLAMKKDKDLLSTDLGVVARDVFGPNPDTRNLKFDRVNKSQHYQAGSMKNKKANHSS